MAVPTNQTMLDNVNTAINARLTGGAVHSYSIGGRDIQYISLAELMKLRDRLQLAVAAEGGDTTNYVKFQRPT